MALNLPYELIPPHARQLLPSAKAVLTAGPETKIKQAVHNYIKTALRQRSGGTQLMEKVFIASETSAGEALTLLRQSSLFAPATLVRVIDVDRWNTSEWQTLLTGISTIQHQSQNSLILETSKELSSLRNIKEKTLTEHGIVTVHATPVKAAELAHLLQAVLRHNSLTIDPDALELLVELAAGSIDKALNELEKIVLACEGVKTISREHLLAYCGLSPSYNYFTLMEALASRNSSLLKAALAYMDEHPHEAPPALIINQIYRFFARLHAFLLAGEKNFAATEELTGISKSAWWRRLFRTATKRYSIAETEEIIKLLASYDAKAKGIGIRPLQQKLLTELALELTHSQSA